MRARVECVLASSNFRPCNRTASAPALVQVRLPAVLRGVRLSVCPRSHARGSASVGSGAPPFPRPPVPLNTTRPILVDYPTTPLSLP